MATTNKVTPTLPIGRGPNRGPGRGMPIEKPKNAKETLRKLVKYISYKKKLFISLMIIMFFVTILNLLSPVLQSSAIDAITPIGSDGAKVGLLQQIVSKIINEDYILTSGKMNHHFFIPFLIMLGICYLFSAALSYFQQRIAAKLSQETVRKMRNDLFQKFAKLPIQFIDTHAHGDLMSRMTNDVENVSNVISQSIGSLISGVMTIIGTLIIMFVYNWLLSLVTILVTCVTITLSRLLTRRMAKYFRKRSKLLGDLNGHVEEMVTGYKTVQAYSKEQMVEEEFNNLSKKYTKVSIIGEIWGGSMGPVMNFFGNLTYLFIAIVGALVLIYHPLGMIISVGTIALFLSSAKQFSRPINEIANLFGQILNAMAGAERIFEILDAKDEIDEGTKTIDENKFQGNISFKNIDFSYVEGQKVLKNFSLEVKKGEKIALVGATGSGKTTIVNLLMRFYEVDSGSIQIDGIDIRDISKDELRHTIAIVLQDTVLFQDTIEKNIKYGRLDASFDEMKDAAILSNANYFIRKLPNRYDTMLTEGGSNLSQGQRQLLSIARAVLANPKILILDEATSSVDTRTEKNLQDAMTNLMKNRTSLIIAHRLSTIQDADKIVVIDHGEILEVGNHKELLQKQGKYYELYMTQFAGKAI